VFLVKTQGESSPITLSDLTRDQSRRTAKKTCFSLKKKLGNKRARDFLFFFANRDCKRTKNREDEKKNLYSLHRFSVVLIIKQNNIHRYVIFYSTY